MRCRPAGVLYTRDQLLLARCLGLLRYVHVLSRPVSGGVDLVGPASLHPMLSFACIPTVLVDTGLYIVCV